MKRVVYLAVGLMLLAAFPSWAGDGLVALQTTDPSCPDDSGNRYVDCSNGTVTDNWTGLVWLKNANCYGQSDWYQSMAAVAGLSDLPHIGGPCGLLTPDQCDCGLSDGSSPGEWRLPSIAEWVTMVSLPAYYGCDPAITNDASDDCWDLLCVNAGACSFYGVQSSTYWSSSPHVSATLPAAWGMYLRFGQAGALEQRAPLYVWPVRGGQ